MDFRRNFQMLVREYAKVVRIFCLKGFEQVVHDRQRIFDRDEYAVVGQLGKDCWSACILGVNF